MNPIHNPVELRHLRTLVVLREAGSLVAAAERLHLTQSALSHQLKALEHQLGLPLFTRNSRPLVFTEAGQRLLTLADELLPRVRAAHQALERLASGNAGRLYLALECHACFDWLMPTLDRYQADHPQIEVDLTLSFPDATLSALARGDIDLAITADPQLRRDVTYRPLFRYENVLVISPRHRLAAVAHVRPQDLRDEMLVTYPVAAEYLDIWSRFLTPAGVAPAEWRRTELTPMLLQLVASGRGVAALPRWAVAEELDRGYLLARPLGPQGLQATLHAAMRSGEAGLPHLAAFVEQARETCLARLADVHPVQEGD
ncbi:MAG: LysR family transcriptional regulator [Gammaproteobacteria bacterium]|nr:LysR family transcriptional regulator [Chromatiales bacterium]MDX5333935.1 LysR family transcriptional regulator [Gammaproteobacteria bacterium]MDX5375451.1 LysR family transcriptional regulator [Gammaproteobacteria bacterium]